MIKFECQQTGKCCISRGEYGYLWLTDEDAKRLASHLNLELEEFVKRHCMTEKGFLRLNPGGTCKFVKGTQCGVYEARPEQCRTWPFWVENMEAKKWDEVSKFCPGIGKGREYSEEEVLEIMKL